MDEDQRELTNRLFAAATAMLEDAVEIAAAGQSSGLDGAQLTKHGSCLRAAAAEIMTIAEAAVIVAASGINQGRNGPKPCP